MRFRTAIPISSGATGRVLRTYDEILGREIAIKLLHRREPALAIRMMREAEAQARLDHPHIAKVYGTGTLDGQPYIAMELIDGCTLDQAVAGLSDRDKAALLADVADALDLAHRAGLIHRDLKPSNILVARNASGRLHPYVIDFGLVRDTGADDLTRTGQLLGTPGYIAPEIAIGGDNVDARADIYSLGVVLFELVASRRPFLGESAAELIVQSLRREPPSLHSLRPDVDPALGRIVRQCLERDPDWRYPTAAALRDDLRAFSDGRRVSARRDSFWQRGRRFVRHHPWRAALAASVGTLAAGLIALSAWSSWYAADQAVKAQQYIDFAAGIEGAIRLEYLMPAHDIAPTRERLRREVAAVAMAMPEHGPAAQRTGQLAIGRARAALGDDVEAHQHLLLAWVAGERSPALDQLLGEVHLRLYWQAMRDAAAVGDEDLREQRVAAALERLRTPARFHLERVAAREDEQATLARALLLHLNGERDQAVALLEEAANAMDWPVDALLFAGEQFQHGARQFLLDGDTDAAAQAVQQAERRYRLAAEIARSHPRAAEGLCLLGGHLSILAGQGASISDDAILDALAHCDAAIALDSTRAEGYASKSNALASRALLERSRAQPPDVLVDEAVAAARAALRLQPDSLSARRALGSLLVTRSTWRLETGSADKTGIDEAVELLEQAHAGDRAEVATAMALADAYHLRARLVEYDGTDPEPDYLKAEQILEAVAPVAQAPPAIEAKLAETRAWRGYYLYRASRDAEPLLRANYDRIRLVRHRVPGHTRIDRAFAYSAWTLADLRTLLGHDPSAEAEAAVAAYEAILTRNPVDYTSLFNVVGPLILLADHRLAHGQEIGELVARLADYTHRLQVLAEDRTPIDVQLMVLNTYQAKVAIAKGRNPLDLLSAGRSHFSRAASNPIDRYAAMEGFANLVQVEHEWRHVAGREDPQRLVEDVAQLQSIRSEFPDSPLLLARVALAMAVPPHQPARVRDAAQMMADAIERMPLLAGRYGAELDRLLVLAR